ncbi:MAG TPA: DNA methyltransferase [Parafilimonas sp.]|nr:DNA methyltransferase [Parafilimonas sp.]
MANRTQLQAALQKPYNRQLFAKDVLSQVFGAGLSVYNIPAKAPVQPTKSEAAVIGNVNIYAAIQLEDGTDITCYEIELQPGKRIEQNKVAIQQYVRKLLTAGQAALVNFISPENPVTWRLTLIAKDSEITGTGIEERTTHAKRYTYLLGSAQSCYTAAQRLAELGNKTAKGIGLKDLTDAFSVAVLTKEFYNELFQWYQWTLTEEVGITFPKNTSITEDDREKLEEQVIRLITRLLFVWFIKQKQLVPSGLFNAAELKKVLKSFNPESATNGNYYNAILQNLFFATLNKAVNERAFAKEAHKRDIKTLYRYTEMFSISEKEVLELFRPIPFLNGGLFECLDKEDLEGNKYFLDGFSRNDTKMKGHFKHRAFIPNCVFFDEQKGIIPLLERYNFTVEENSPEDVQVALDPELLGNVFENLLGVYNPETKESARKQSGSFYTPREIVSFMVSESLIAYLTNACPQLKPDTVRSLFENEALPEELQGKEQLCKDVSGKLKAVKILDPACGSGAFPMGILKKMVEVLDKLDLKNIKTVYEQKLHLIEECIYGVDIQTIAAQISKLRFFISLICEQEEMDLSKPGENYGVITLPNLETKFVAANTLIGLHKKPAQTNLFEDPRIETVKKEILAIRHEHFYAKTTDKKKQLREKDEKLRAELVKLLAANGDFAPEDAKQLAQWNPYDQNTSSPFFDTEWMFGLQKEKGLLNTTARLL